MAIVTKVHTFNAGAVVVASEHNTNLDNLYNDYNGNITNANMSASAGIVDTKLAQITTANKVSNTAIANYFPQRATMWHDEATVITGNALSHTIDLTQRFNTCQEISNPEKITNGTFTGSASSWTLEDAWVYLTNKVGAGVLGAEKITNGTFTGGSSPWYLNYVSPTDGWVYGSNAVHANTTAGWTRALYQYFSGMVTPPVVGETYRVTLTVSNYVSGTLWVYLGLGGSTLKQISANGTFSFVYMHPSGYSNFHIDARPNTVLTVDNVSFKKVSPASALYQPVANMVSQMVNGYYYRLQFTISDYVEGLVVVTCGGRTLATLSGNGTFYYDFSCLDNTQPVKFTSKSGAYFTSLSIDDVSLKRIYPDGYSFSNSFFLKAGTHNFNVLGITDNGNGKIDWYIDNMVTPVISGQDWYSASVTYNVVKTASVTIATDGYHKLVGTINGKNESSSNYILGLTKYWLQPATDGTRT